MEALLLLVLVLGVVPLVAGLVLSRPGGEARPPLASVLLCALAFNLTFFWQELWLVLPKAMAGLQPTLFHNDHAWSVQAPSAELLQGTGALATLSSGLAFLALLRFGRLSPTWRLFAFWMAAQGLFQALSQLAIGTQIAGNDVGRALAWLAVPDAGKLALLALAAAGLAAAGAALARLSPLPLGGRGAALALLAAAAIAVPLILPFRVPRHPVEVAPHPRRGEPHGRRLDRPGRRAYEARRPGAHARGLEVARRGPRRAPGDLPARPAPGDRVLAARRAA
ncbi:hypothetical protein [Phenylobacterium sp. J367]|uniref:hypothetical protein n=1 Tax=Phenylobacterium sp. J367 TaxID=2898435 RepID=UPI0021511451|nr:hypothetical protein [Phenylobacterium sp. J367]MCR5879167.1 hypothetical protein [Phenylobacterium sp. J367]